MVAPLPQELATFSDKVEQEVNVKHSLISKLFAVFSKTMLRMESWKSFNHLKIKQQKLISSNQKSNIKLLVPLQRLQSFPDET